MLTVKKSNIVKILLFIFLEFYYETCLLLQNKQLYCSFAKDLGSRLERVTLYQRAKKLRFGSVSLKQVPNDFLNSDVADRLSEEERLHAACENRVQSREEKQQTAEANL